MNSKSKQTKASNAFTKLGPYVRSIDFALEWLQLESGKALYHQNDEGDCTYVGKYCDP